MLAKVAELPVTMIGHTPTVPVNINGVDAAFIADSGAFFSSISSHEVERLKLRERDGQLEVTGAGGQVRAGLSVAKELSFGGLPTLRDMYFVVLPENFGDRISGLLGQNVLGFADTEYDLARGVIHLVQAKGCEHAVPAYWATPGQAVSMVEFKPTNRAGPHILGEARINGQAIRVMFDTGTPRSLLKLKAAERLGFRRDATGVSAGSVQSGIGPGFAESWIAPFDSFEIGGEQINHTKLFVSDVNLPNADMLIGADFFVSHRIYVSQAQHRLYFTYNGGPVFRLDDTATKVTAGPQDRGPDPADADAFSRRASASMTRHDYAGAVADFTRAIELKPDVAATYLHRGEAHLAAGDRGAAKADLDKAVALDPKSLDALLARSGYYLDDKDVVRAKADFDAALKGAPKDSGLELDIATLYAEAGAFDEALALYDAWLTRHAKDGSAVLALNGRCWTRALAGRDLDKALDDCNAALRRAPRMVAILDSKGLVLLRMGRFGQAIAAYDDALKLQPRQPSSLYGRGLARRAGGDAAAGDADIRLARELDPKLLAKLEKFGIAPLAAAPADAKGQ